MSMSNSEIGLVLLGVLVVITIFSCAFTVQQQTEAVIERFGKYVRAAGPGLNFKIPFIERISRRMSLRILQITVSVSTLTADKVSVDLGISVQYHVLPGKVFEAAYKLNNHLEQINSFVFDVVRATVPKMKLDDVFEKKDNIAVQVKTELSDIMEQFGYGIVKALVTDIEPDAKVRDAMNQINEAQRLRVAATERGEAEKILKVKAAEAEARSTELQGVGMANQRKALIDGLKDSIADFKDAIAGTDAREVMNLVLLTQYFDTLKSMGDKGNNTVMLPHSPGGLSDFAAQMRDAMISANLAVDSGDKPK
jgi:regulator of protease activity HflC (stomatin/prohibitin superfamily)